MTFAELFPYRASPSHAHPNRRDLVEDEQQGICTQSRIHVTVESTLGRINILKLCAVSLCHEKEEQKLFRQIILFVFSAQLTGDNDDLAQRFLTALAICNTSFIIHDHPELMDRIHYEPKYEGDNADDLVLCQAASNFGVRMISRSAQNILVRYLDQTNTNMIDRDYEILCLLPFDSTRRRMSIIVRLDDQIFLFIKGAETSIWPHLSPLNDPQLKSTTEQHSLVFAQQGYRSLLVAYRQLSLHTFEDWFERYRLVANSLLNREEAISDAATEIEVDLMLAGLTAVEDKLQEGVPQAIATLRCAGIKIWLLTGDKQATALSTAQAASLINKIPDLSSVSASNDRAPFQVVRASCIAMHVLC